MTRLWLHNALSGWYMRGKRPPGSENNPVLWNEPAFFLGQVTFGLLGFVMASNEPV